MKYVFTILVVLYSYVVAGTTDTTETNHDTPSSLNRVRRGGLSMLRLGRGLQMLRLGKRAMPMLRLGRGVESYSQDEVLAMINTLLGRERGDRQVPLPRYGRRDLEVEMLLEYLLSDPQFQERRSMNLYNDDEDSPRSINPGPRPGYRYRRSVPEVPPQGAYDEEKFEKMMEDKLENDDEVKDSEERTVPLPRFGRCITGEDCDEDIKRAMPMLRLGRAMAMLRLGKRPMNMLRLGRSDASYDDELDKRAMPMLRLGKRPFKMLRLGKRYDELSEEPEIKRNLRMMRLGRGGDKRAMPMLRLGRSAEQ